jgi:hypothetical protein
VVLLEPMTGLPKPMTGLLKPLTGLPMVLTGLRKAAGRLTEHASTARPRRTWAWATATTWCRTSRGSRCRS